MPEDNLNQPIDTTQDNQATSQILTGAGSQKVIEPSQSFTQEVQTRKSQAVEALKAAKAEGLTYYDATQSLRKQGFNPEEIEQASYQFPYSEATPADPNSSRQATSANQAFAEAMVHEEAIDNAKQELHEDVAKSIVGGRSVFGTYYTNKTIGDYAALKNLESNKPLDGTDKKPDSSPAGTRVFQRNRAIRIYAYISLIPLVLLGPYFFALIHNLPTFLHTLFSTHNLATFPAIAMYFWSAAGYVAYVCIALLLFMAHKTATIIRAIYIIMAADFAMFAVFALITKRPTFLVLGVMTMLPAYWISKRVGLLAELD